MSDLITLQSAVAGLSTGDTRERVLGTKKSGPGGVESIIEYNGIYLNVRNWIDTYLVNSVEGIDGAEVRDSREANPGRHGETPGISLYSGRTISLSGKVMAKTLWKLRDMQSGLRQSFAQLDQELPLIFRTGGDPDSDYMIYCKLSQKINMPEQQDSLNDFKRNFQIMLRASNPRFLSVVQIRSALEFADLRQFQDIESSTLESFPSVATLNQYGERGGGFDVANSMMMPKAVVRNLVPDSGTMEDAALPKWVQGSVAYTSVNARQNGWAAYGTYSRRVTMDTTSASGRAMPLSVANIEVTAGKYYTFSAWINVLARSSSSMYATFKIDYFDKDNNEIGAVDASYANTLGVQRVVGTLKAPPGAVKARLGNMIPSGGTIDYYVDAVQLQEGQTATPFVSGDLPGCMWEGAQNVSASRQVAKYVNWVSKPGFEDGTTGNFNFSASSGTGSPAASLTVTTDWVRHRSRSARYQVTREESNAVVVRAPTGTNGIPVRPGERWGVRASMRLRTPPPGGTFNIARINTYWYKANGASSDIRSGDSQSSIDVGTVAGATFDFDYIPPDAPSDAAFMTFGIVMDTNAVPAVYDYDVDSFAAYNLTGDPRTTVPPFFDGWQPGFVFEGASDASPSSGPWGDINMSLNPDVFAGTSTGWGVVNLLAGSTSVVASGGPVDDAAYVKGLADGGADSGFYKHFQLDVDQEQPYSLGMFVRSSRKMPCYFQINWYDKSGATMQSDYSSDFMSSTEWSECVMEGLIAPVGAATARLYIRWRDSKLNDRLEADKSMIVQSLTLPDFFAGNSYDAEYIGGSTTTVSHKPFSSMLLTTRSYQQSMQTVKFTTPPALSTKYDAVRFILAYKDDNNMLYARFYTDGRLSFRKRVNGVDSALVTQTPNVLAANTDYWLRARLAEGRGSIELFTADPVPGSTVKVQGAPWTINYNLTTDEIQTFQDALLPIGIQTRSYGGKFKWDSWKYEPLDEPLDFDASLVMSGAGSVAVRNGKLRPLDANQKILIRKDLPFKVANGVISLMHGRDDALTTGGSSRLGVIGKVLSYNTFIEARVLQSQGSGYGLYLNLIDNGTPVALHSVTIPTVNEDTDYWVRLVMDNNNFRAEHWTTDPALGGSPSIQTNTIALAGAQADKFGAGVKGDVGINWQTPDPMSSWIDNFQLSFVSFDDIAFVAHNDGNFAAQPIWEMRGPLSGLTVVNEATDTAFLLNTAIPAGETWIYDLTARTPRLYRESDGANRFQYLDGASDTVEFEPGDNPIRVVATGLSIASRVIARHRHTVM